MLKNQSALERANLSLTIKHEELTLGKELGRGGFGVVYQGTYRHNDVAVKQLLMDKISNEGHPRSMFNAATMLEYGDGVSQNKTEALTWYRKVDRAAFIL